jgi:hypothetical protein
LTHYNDFIVKSVTALQNRNIHHTSNMSLIFCSFSLCYAVLHIHLLVYCCHFVLFQPSAQQEAGHKPAQSFPLTEVPKIPASATSVTEKSQLPLGSKAVPENKKSLSAASGLTPIELTRTLPLRSTCAVATSQATTVPEAVSAVGATKQKLSQVSDPADVPKPPFEM